MKKNNEKIDFSTLSSIVAGTGVGAYGAGSFILSGLICPACIVLTPTLLGYGFYNYKKSEVHALKIRE